MPESGSDFELGDAFPHDALLDQMDVVGFKKGCYVGRRSSRACSIAGRRAAGC